MSFPASSSEGKKGVRWPGLSAPLPETRYGPNWFAKDLEMKVVEEGDEEVKWSKARISSELPGKRWVWSALEPSAEAVATRLTLAYTRYSLALHCVGFFSFLFYTLDVTIYCVCLSFVC